MKTKIALITLILLGSVLYIVTIRGVFGNPNIQDVRSLEGPAMPFESSHERAPYAQLLSLVNEKRFDLSKELADMGAPDVGFDNGKFYSYFPPGVTLAIYPAYKLGEKYELGLLFAYLVVPIFALVSLWMIYLIAREVFGMPIWASVFVALIFGFSTTSWSYSITIYQHAFSTSLFLLCFFAAYKFKHANNSAFLWGTLVWLTYGASIFIDYPNILIFMPVIGYFIISSISWESMEKSIRVKLKVSGLVTFFVFAIMIGAHGYLNNKMYGSPTKLSNTLPRYERDKFDELLATGVQSIVPDVDRGELKLNATFKEEKLPSGLFTLLFADDKGIFFYSPILLFAFVGIYFFFKKFNIEFLALLFVFIINLCLYASFGDPWGGWAYGPRYLILSMPILAIYAGYGLWKTINYQVAKFVAFALTIFSTATALLGAITTNVVPPKIEAIPYKLPYYNYLLNIDFLQQNIGGSFIFNNYLKNHLLLTEYYFIILGVIIFVYVIIIFILPHRESHNLHG